MCEGGGICEGSIKYLKEVGRSILAFEKMNVFRKEMHGIRSFKRIMLIQRVSALFHG